MPAQANEDASIDEVLADETLEVEEGAPTEGERVGRPHALDTSAANRLAAARRPTVLVLAGAVGSGKTSVYAAIYERLGRGPFGGWLFAGSQTIPGFEQRCHWWRVESGGTEPWMEHTRAEDLPWLHLQLRDVALNSPALDLLFGDFDGEVFQAVLDGRRSAVDLPFLRRADHVGLVVDGARLADPTQRAAEIQQAQYLLSALAVADALAGPKALSIVVTKTDTFEIRPADDRAEIEEHLRQLNEKANESMAAEVPLLRLAVRSRTSEFPLGHGLETLLEVLSLRPALQVGAAPEGDYVTTALGRFFS